MNTIQALAKEIIHMNKNPLAFDLHDFASTLFPICRSLTGDGVRKTLSLISERIPIRVHEIPSGTTCFDWTVPDEWNISEAYIEEVGGARVVDFKDNNLHVVGYSEPTDVILSLDELRTRLFSLPDMPNAIPYVTSYYNKTWGFCVTHATLSTLKDTMYRCVIKSRLEPGNLTYADCHIAGSSNKEIFLSTNICHPSMANNEISGPVVLTYIIKWIMQKQRRYSYRIAFVPETIGSIAYIGNNLEALKNNVIAGFNLTCVGDDEGYSFISSRYGNSYADKVADNHMSHNHKNHIRYSFLDRGSDERQYCSAGVDMPLVTLCRSRYYPHYHTSLDNLDYVTPDGLYGGYNMVKDCLEIIENNYTYRTTCTCEPQLGKRGLYPNISTKNSHHQVKPMMDALAYMDGRNDLIDISNRINIPMAKLLPMATRLREAGLIEAVFD